MSTDQSWTGSDAAYAALEGNISVDSLYDSQRPPVPQTTAELTFDATDSPLSAPEVKTNQTGGDINSFQHEPLVSFGPTIREAEEFADQMTSEILEQGEYSRRRLASEDVT